LVQNTSATRAFWIEARLRLQYHVCQTTPNVRLAVWLLATASAFSACSPALSAPESPADSVYRHGLIYTIDGRDSIAQALAVRQGVIVYVGDDAGVRTWIGARTAVHDLGGRMMMPGLIDGHLHPLGGGHTLISCNLNYERLTALQFQEHIRKCLADTQGKEPDGWLEVRNWFQEAMIGNAVMSKAILDELPTHRPILVVSSFGHTALVNTRALTLAHIDAQTADPPGGQIMRDAQGRPTGLLQDAASGPVLAVLPTPTAAEDQQAALATLQAFNAQGVTAFLDAAAGPQSLAAFAALEKSQRLTARAHFAILIRPADAADPAKAAAAAHALAVRYDEGELRPEPRLSVHNVKLFMDGIITAPALTGAMLEPYFTNTGTADKPHWVSGTSRGPAPYFSPQLLREILLATAHYGLEPHLHADGDAAVHAALDGIEAVRPQYPAGMLRAAIAHDEIVDPRDFPRFGALDVVPVLSFQWEKPAPDTVDGEQNYLGPTRYRYIEPAAFLSDAGARIAFGSDWPVDPLNEWFALKVGVTRTNAPDVAPQYRGRLSQDRGLTRAQVLRAATQGSAYELHAETRIGSLEVGKLADLIILDRNPLESAAEDIAHVRVLETIVGGRSVYRAPQAPTPAQPLH
jgi:predicted amidohydrolase YtcJ